INRRFEKAAAVRDLPRMLDVKAEFRSTAARATRNRFLAEALLALREKAYAVRCASWQDPDRARETVQVHEEMIRALRARRSARPHARPRSRLGLPRRVPAASLGAGAGPHTPDQRPPPPRATQEVLMATIE